MSAEFRVAIVTISDRASRGEYSDRGGPAVEAWLDDRIPGSWQALKQIIPDSREQIEETLIALVDDEGCHLVVTTGGTGPAPSDVTPEATRNVCERLLPGFGERMRAVSVETVPTAILSRQEAGLRGQALLLNLPGNPKAIGECLEAVWPAIPHLIALVGGPSIQAPGISVDPHS
ncbi:MAG TPA: molybdopterin adenylyltransferase [Planctomycetes bacterium]|nr:molybdopterin adenylyltransferase [Planctomycetota bacterium]HIN79554.1 molybdopterin adenylyltransferase [Planctomycetota bacterium]